VKRICETMKIRTVLSLFVFVAAAFDAALAADAIEKVDSGSAPAEAVKVDISKMKYAPAAIEVEEGATVTWTNHDAVPHNVFLSEPLKVVGDMLRAGQSLSLKFNTAGEYGYICTPHPFMKGKVTVKPKS
jgi:amicyanin